MSPTSPGMMSKKALTAETEAAIQDQERAAPHALQTAAVVVEALSEAAEAEAAVEEEVPLAARAHANLTGCATHGTPASTTTRHGSASTPTDATTIQTCHTQADRA